MRGLEGRSFVVTGGASGIGSATCERLAAEGASVAIVDRNRELAEKRAAELASKRAKVIAIAADVGSEEAVVAAVERAARELGGLSGLVTSAGIFDGGDMRL